MEKVRGKAVLLLLGTFCSCGIIPSVGPDYERPKTQVPASWSSTISGESGFADPKELGTWWKILSDEHLNKLIERALEANKSYAIIESKVREAKENRSAALGGFFPQINFGLGFTKNKISKNTNQGVLFGNNQSGLRLIQKNWELGFDSAWELDLFGGLRRSYEAADAAVESAEEQLNDGRISLIAEVIRNYFEVRSLEKRLTIARENIQIQGESLDIVKSRVDAGLASDLDRTQAWAQLENTKSTLPTLEALSVNSRNRLAVLLGETVADLVQDCPREAIGSGAMIVNKLPTGVLQGVPSDILRNRPDVRVAERNLAAQVALVGVSTADLFPKFSITGNLGLASLRSQDFLEASSKTWSFGPRVSLPIFTGGRLLAQLRAQSERANQATSQYEQIVLQALAESESTISAYEQEKSRFETLKRAHDASLQSLSLSRELYQKGLADFLRVIESQRTAFLAEDIMAQSEQQMISNFIAVYKALGYGWQLEQPVERLSDSGAN